MGKTSPPSRIWKEEQKKSGKRKFMYMNWREPKGVVIYSFLLEWSKLPVTKTTLFEIISSLTLKYLLFFQSFLIPFYSIKVCHILLRAQHDDLYKSLTWSPCMLPHVPSHLFLNFILIESNRLLHSYKSGFFHSILSLRFICFF